MSQWQRVINILDSIRKSLWPIGVFRDASKGNLLERAAAYRHNRDARGCLPRYITNWVLVGISFAAVGSGLDAGSNLTASIFCWVLVSYTVAELAVLSAIYIALTAWEY